MKILAWFQRKAELDKMAHKLSVKESEIGYLKGQLAEYKAKYEAEIVRLKKDNKHSMEKLEETLFKLDDAEKKILSLSSGREKTSNAGGNNRLNPKPANKSKNK